jgi:hypothetical protein
MARTKSDQSLILLSEERRKGPSVIQLFLNRTPEYLPNAANSKAIQKYLRRNKLDVSLLNLERAFNVLKIEGRLELRVVPPKPENHGPIFWEGTTVPITEHQPQAAPKTILAPNAADKKKEKEYVARPLTRDEIAQMGTEERIWHSENNTRAWIDALKDSGVGTNS